MLSTVSSTRSIIAVSIHIQCPSMPPVSIFPWCLPSVSNIHLRSIYRSHLSAVSISLSTASAVSTYLKYPPVISNIHQLSQISTCFLKYPPVSVACSRLSCPFSHSIYLLISICSFWRLQTNTRMKLTGPNVLDILLNRYRPNRNVPLQP